MPKLSWKYGKIMSIFQRDEKTHKFLSEYSTPEIKYLKDNKWSFQEKIDGKNIRVKWNGKEVVYAGRSDEAQLELSLVYKLDELFKSYEGIQNLVKVFQLQENEEVVFYGEGCGTKIQKGGERYNQNGVDFILFDVLINDIYLEKHNVDDVAQKLGIKSAPIIGRGTLAEAIEMTKKGFKSQWGDFIAEGIVARPLTELFTRKGDRIITKIKYKDFK
jgi:hypothetical protein